MIAEAVLVAIRTIWSGTNIGCSELSDLQESRHQGGIRHFDGLGYPIAAGSLRPVDLAFHTGVRFSVPHARRRDPTDRESLA